MTDLITRFVVAVEQIAAALSVNETPTTDTPTKRGPGRPRKDGSPPAPAPAPEPTPAPVPAAPAATDPETLRNLCRQFAMELARVNRGELEALLKRHGVAAVREVSEDKLPALLDELKATVSVQ
jgi:predicted component of type VI protein secretion system